MQDLSLWRQTDWDKLYTAEQRQYCCERYGRACKVQDTEEAVEAVDTEDGFDCTVGASNWIKSWSFEKMDWCCKQQQVGCRKFHCSGVATCQEWWHSVFLQWVSLVQFILVFSLRNTPGKPTNVNGALTFHWVTCAFCWHSLLKIPWSVMHLGLNVLVTLPAYPASDCTCSRCLARFQSPMHIHYHTCAVEPYLRAFQDHSWCRGAAIISRRVASIRHPCTAKQCAFCKEMPCTNLQGDVARVEVKVSCEFWSDFFGNVVHRDTDLRDVYPCRREIYLLRTNAMGNVPHFLGQGRRGGNSREPKVCISSHFMSYISIFDLCSQSLGSSFWLLVPGFLCAWRIDQENSCNLAYSHVQVECDTCRACSIQAWFQKLRCWCHAFSFFFSMMSAVFYPRSPYALIWSACISAIAI